MDNQFDFLDGFSPQGDPEAAIKFSLGCALMENRVGDLSWLATDGHEFGGVSGEPGWEIERRDSSSIPEATGFELWPNWASFRAYVDPDAYRLAYPETYVSGARFYALLCEGLESYIRAKGINAAMAQSLLDGVRLNVDNWSLGRPPATDLT